MRALSFCQDLCPEKLSFKLGNLLGDGVDGEVYELLDYPNKVIKFCIHYELRIHVTESYQRKIVPVLTSLINNPIDIFARVYAHEYLVTFRPYNYDFVLYYYIMEKLENISDDEKKVFHTILSHEDNNKKKDYSISEVQTILRDMGRSLDFDETRIIAFHKALKKAPINHGDIHPRNIMKDKEGNFRLIDFDSCQLKLPCNP